MYISFGTFVLLFLGKNEILYMFYFLYRFTVNLMCGLDTDCDDRPLHISVRFKINTVVRNIYHRNSWDTEERSGCFPFTMGKDFTMVIVVKRDSYEVSNAFFAIFCVIVNYYCEIAKYDKLQRMFRNKMKNFIPY